MMDDLHLIDILTAALVLITAFYAWATFKILKANQNVVREMQASTVAFLRPYIMITPMVRAGESMMFLRIQNAGRSPAQHVRLTIDKGFYRFDKSEEKDNISTYPIFQSEIIGLPSGFSMDIDLGRGIDLFGEKSSNQLRPLQFSIKCQYKYGDLQFDERIDIDLQVLKHAAVSTDTIVTSIQNINRSLTNIRDSLEGIRWSMPTQEAPYDTSPSGRTDEVHESHFAGE